MTIRFNFPLALVLVLALVLALSACSTTPAAPETAPAEEAPAAIVVSTQVPTATTAPAAEAYSAGPTYTEDPHAQCSGLTMFERQPIEGWQEEGYEIPPYQLQGEEVFEVKTEAGDCFRFRYNTETDLLTVPTGVKVHSSSSGYFEITYDNEVIGSITGKHWLGGFGTKIGFETA